MKRFMVFVIEQYYPSGGLSDVKASFNTVEEAREFARVQLQEAGYLGPEIQIFDRVNGEKVAFFAGERCES